MAAIEFYENSHVHIGENLYRLNYHEEPRPGFHRYSVETYGAPQFDSQNRFDLSDFSGLYFNQLPESFSLSAYDPRLNYRLIDSLWFHKHDGHNEVVLSFSHYYTEWTYSTNLIHFYQKLHAGLLSNSPYPAQVDIDKDEYGVSARVTYSADVSDDIATHISKGVRHIQDVVQEHLIHASSISDVVTSQILPLKPDEHGWKWWLRYVAVPLGIALIATVAAFLKYTK